MKPSTSPSQLKVHAFKTISSAVVDFWRSLLEEPTNDDHHYFNSDGNDDWPASVKGTFIIQLECYTQPCF